MGLLEWLLKVLMLTIVLDLNSHSEQWFAGTIPTRLRYYAMPTWSAHPRRAKIEPMGVDDGISPIFMAQ